MNRAAGERPPTGPILCFGEILWDHLPTGRFMGGAPLNVAVHLRRLGRRALPVSAVGDDGPGAEALATLNRLGVDTRAVAIRRDLPTGTVRVSLDADGNPRFTIAEPAAWDRIPNPSGAAAIAAENPRAVVFGSLALRQAPNRRTLARLLKATAAIRICDINLRPPHDDRARALRLARRADLLKLNRQELLVLSGAAAGTPLEAAVAALQRRTGCRRICVTLGADGAILLDHGRWHRCRPEPVTVRDTVGAGDAFTAVLAAALTARATPPWPAVLADACRLAAYVASRSGATPAYDAARLGLVLGP